MASIGHVAVGLAARRWSQRDWTSGWSTISTAVLWSGLSLLPDADVVGFRFGVPYAAPWGHRGATHSLMFPVIVGHRFLSARGLRVAVVELIAFAPLFAYGLWPKRHAPRDL